LEEFKQQLVDKEEREQNKEERNRIRSQKVEKPAAVAEGGGSSSVIK